MFWLYLGGMESPQRCRQNRVRWGLHIQSPPWLTPVSWPSGWVQGERSGNLYSSPPQLGAFSPTSCALDPIFPTPSGTCTSMCYLLTISSTFPSLLVPSYHMNCVSLFKKGF